MQFLLLVWLVWGRLEADTRREKNLLPLKTIKESIPWLRKQSWYRKSHLTMKPGKEKSSALMVVWILKAHVQHSCPPPKKKKKKKKDKDTATYQSMDLFLHHHLLLLPTFPPFSFFSSSFFPIFSCLFFFLAVHPQHLSIYYIHKVFQYFALPQR